MDASTSILEASSHPLIKSVFASIVSSVERIYSKLASIASWSNSIFDNLFNASATLTYISMMRSTGPALQLVTIIPITVPRSSPLIISSVFLMCFNFFSRLSKSSGTFLSTSTKALASFIISSHINEILTQPRAANGINNPSGPFNAPITPKAVAICPSICPKPSQEISFITS